MARNPMQNQGGRVFRCQQLVVTLDRTGISGVKQLLEHFTAIEQHVSLTAMNPLTCSIAIFCADTKFASTITKQVDIADGFQLGHSVHERRTSASTKHPADLVS